MIETAEKVESAWVDAVFQKQRMNLQNLRTTPLNARKARLIKLRNWIRSNRETLCEAMYLDFKKPAAEVEGIEVFHVLNEIQHALQNLDTWSRATRVAAPIAMIGSRSYIIYEPRGLCLIISPWNYPFSLCIGPLVSALAAGNSIIIKPSELTPNVSALIAKMVSDIFESEIVAVCEGDVSIAKHLLQLPFDHIFFTGSSAIGKAVMHAAAENLSSVTLELGGKSPTIVTSSAIIKDAAKRIAVAKFVNNGQTCVAPDYILVEEKIADAFTQQLIDQTISLFTENKEPFEHSKHYARIVNQKHFKRLDTLLNDALTKGATLAFGGNMVADSLFFEPTILTNLPDDSRIMEEEIFGPILPVITYKNIEEAIAYVNSKPKALALYVFTASRTERRKVLQETSSGGVCVNDCAIHFMHHNLPFGGVNNSGIGRSHGYAGFLAFSNEKSVLRQRNGFTSVQLFYPPYTAFKQKLMNWFFKLL